MKRITYKITEGNIYGITYVYNFSDGNESYNKEFAKMLGRNRKDGIHSLYTPETVGEILLHHYLEYICYLPTSTELGKAQKQIDMCNSRQGCNHCCSSQRQKDCSKLKLHTSLVEKLGRINEFRFLEFEEVK